MKPNLLTHILRLTILFLLFFGWGTGTAVAGSGLECRDAKPAISHEGASVGAESNSAIIAQRLTDWGIPSPPSPSSRFTQFKSDLESAGDDLINFFADKGKDGLMAWELVKHLDEGVRLNVNALGKLDNLLTSGKIPKAKLESSLNSHLGDILNAADEVNVGKILDRLNLQHVDELHFDNILQRLDDYPTLTQDLIDNPDWFDTFDDILDKPGRYWEIVDEAELPNNTALTKWGQGFWWKDLRDLAKNFEDGVALNNFKSVNGITSNTNVVTQVTLEVNGTKIRIDYLGQDAGGKFHFGDAKYSTKDKNWNSDWISASTTNQNTVFTLFESGGVNNIVVKATDPDKLDELAEIGLANNSTIQFSNTSMKIFGSEANQQTVQTVVTLKN